MGDGSKDTGDRRANRADHGRDETSAERADRNMAEILQELRVVQAGVQILFGFLLSLSFTERFTRLDEFQRDTFVVTLLLSVLTAGLLIAPAAAHRVTFHHGLKPETVKLGHRLFSLGLVSLVLTLTGAVLLVLDVAVGRTFGLIAAAAVAAALVALWFALPMPLRAKRAFDDPNAGGSADRDDSGTDTGADDPVDERQQKA